MKQLVKTMLRAVVLTGALFASTAYAEDQGKGIKKMPHHEMTAEQWKGKIGLTDEQAEKLKAAMKKQTTGVRPQL